MEGLNVTALSKAKKLSRKSSFYLRNSLSGQKFYVTQGKLKLENSCARCYKTKKPIEQNICKSTSIQVFYLIKLKLQKDG